MQTLLMSDKERRRVVVLEKVWGECADDMGASVVLGVKGLLLSSA
jgi:hypothetical protein